MTETDHDALNRASQNIRYEHRGLRALVIDGAVRGAVDYLLVRKGPDDLALRIDGHERAWLHVAAVPPVVGMFPTITKPAFNTASPVVSPEPAGA